ncbi:MAG: hypothetical protein K0U47_08165 [Epsilonproteobacteria bacterium]|nr:hypothetical protein [Campylobacterota bacterium]
MKRNSLLTGVVLSTALSAVLTGCGSTSATVDDITNDITEEIKQASISGKAIDGYLQFATVCLDIDADGYCQQTEPHSQTAADGSFTLTIEQSHRDQEKFDEALLLVFGGKDVDTGKDFRGKLYAPNDGSEQLNVSPITTLVAKNLEKEIKDQTLTREEIKEKIKQAKAKVAKALDIKEEEVGVDPVAFQQENQDDRLIKKALQVQKSVEALMFAAEVADSEQKDKIEDIYEAMADGLDDLTEDEQGIDKLLEKAAKKEHFKALFTDKDEAAILAVADAITQNLDIAFENIEYGEDQLEKIAAITEDAFAQIEENVKNEESDFISGVVYLEDDDRFKPQHDWIAEYIKQDLREIGIEPSEELINKLKAIYKNEIQAGVLFYKAQQLSENNDEQIQEVYQKILELQKQERLKKEAEEARYDGIKDIDLKDLMAGKTFYEIDRSGYCEQEADGTANCVVEYELNSVMINETATQVTVGDETLEIKVEGRNIFVKEDDHNMILTFKKESDKYIELYHSHGDIIKLYKNIADAETHLAEVQTQKESTPTENPESDFILKSYMAGQTFYVIEAEEIDAQNSAGILPVEFWLNKIMVSEDGTTAESANENAQLQFERNSVTVYTSNETFVLTLKKDTDEYLELFEDNDESVKLFKNERVAKDTLEHMQQEYYNIYENLTKIQ